MTDWQNNPGTLALADGTVVTTAAATAAPDQFTPTNGGSGSALTFEVAGPRKFWQFFGNAAAMRGDVALSAARFGAHGKGKLPVTAPTVDQILCTFNTTSGPRLAKLTTGQLAVFSAAGNVYTTPVSITGDFRFYLGAEIGAGTADGELHFKLWHGANVDGATADYSYDSSTANVQTSNYPHVRFAKCTTAGVYTVEWDWMRVVDTAYTDPGPLSGANVAPTANAGADQTNVEPGATVTLNGSGSSDSDGTIASYTWTQTGGSPTVTLSGSGASRTFSAPLTLAGTTLTFSLTVTDDDGATSSTDTMTVAVLPVSERIAIGGSWVPALLRVL